MYKITAKEKLNPNIDFIKVEAPAVARKAKPGQFVVIRVDEYGERIPLTLADWDDKEGTITLVAMKVGTSTYKLSSLNIGDYILNLVGPLGLATEIEKFGTVICIGGGVGIAPIFPIARELRKEGNKVISIIGARGDDLLFWKDRMRDVSDDLIVTTDDGSYARKGLVTEPLKELLEGDEKIARVIAIGPCSSRTLPGQGYATSRSIAASEIRVTGFLYSAA